MHRDGPGSGGVWVVAILANVVYAAYSWLTAEEVIIKVEESAEDGYPRSHHVGEDVFEWRVDGTERLPGDEREQNQHCRE